LIPRCRRGLPARRAALPGIAFPSLGSPISRVGSLGDENDIHFSSRFFLIRRMSFPHRFSVDTITRTEYVCQVFFKNKPTKTDKKPKPIEINRWLSLAHGVVRKSVKY
jgi:hypothetical protein